MTHSAADEPYDVDADGGIDGPAGDPDAPAGSRKEPMAVVSATQLIVAALVTLGWATADDPILPTIGTVIGGVVAVVTWLIGRSKVKAL